MYYYGFKETRHLNLFIVFLIRCLNLIKINDTDVVVRAINPMSAELRRAGSAADVAFRNALVAGVGDAAYMLKEAEFEGACDDGCEPG